MVGEKVSSKKNIYVSEKNAVLKIYQRGAGTGDERPVQDLEICCVQETEGHPEETAE